DVAPCLEMGREPLGGAVVEGGEGGAIGRIGGGDLDRHRIGQFLLHRPRPDIALDDGAAVAAMALLAEIGEDRGRGDQTRCLERHQLGVAGTDPDAVKATPGAHSFSLASALIAAAVMALPPLRPRTTSQGTLPQAASSSFDSAAPTKPTGTPRMA